MLLKPYQIMNCGKLITGAFLLLTNTILLCQETVETIEPDRPGYGDAVSIVPKKYLQLETGFWFEQDKTPVSTTKGIGINSTLFRYGLSEKTELRFDYSVWNSRKEINLSGSGTVAETGLFPCRLGIKALLLEHKDWIPTVTFVGMLGFPWLASDNFKPDYVSPDLQLSCANPVNDWFTICYNLGLSWDGSNPSPQQYYALSAEFAPSEKTGAYLQGRASRQKTIDSNGATTQNLLYTETGFVYYPQKNIQIDLSGGVKVGEFVPDAVSTKDHSYFFLSAGLSWRFPG